MKRDFPLKIKEHAEKYIQIQMNKHHAIISREEQVSEFWCVYLEGIYSYTEVAGCCNLEAYLDYCLSERINELKTQRNARISLESKLSIDMKPLAGEQIGWLVGRVGDFTCGVMLWDYIDSFGEKERYVANRLYYRNSPQEIVAEGRISMKEYEEIVLQLRERFCDWSVA